MSPLNQLEACGQSPWLDSLSRRLVDGGGLRDLIAHDGVTGVTSNPSIFEKAIGEGDDYDEPIRRFLAGGDHGPAAIYEHLVIADIRAAADLLRETHRRTDGRDGYVSLECSPYLANDTDATAREALRLWAAVDRTNLMVKVPATAAGVPAIRALIGRGLNINVTLLFGQGVYEQVVEAYLLGLEDRAAAGGDLSRIGSVASLFVSRIDVAIDKRLEAPRDAPAAARLRGKVAIANAKIIYQRYKALFSGPRWDRLAAAGARPQRLLWASTSAKDPAFKDTMYVEALIGPDTVDTLPPATLKAFRDHGEVRADAIEQDLAGARAILADLAGYGVSLTTVTDALVEDGVALFSDAFDTLFAAIARRRLAVIEGARPGVEISAGSPELKAAFDAELDLWRKRGDIRRLWSGDASLWTGADESQWMGWLGIVQSELRDIYRARDFAEAVKDRGFTDIVLMGMGGSSLGPEVLGETFGSLPGWPRFHLLDTTDPARIRATEAAVKLASTLFIVSSKSGSTLEPNILLDYFFARVSAAIGAMNNAGDHFAAVTDPGSPLEARAKRKKFFRVFHGAPPIGGRYSVLSKFGVTPGAAMGIDVKRLLEATRPMQRSCGPDVPPAENPGVRLGVALGVAAARFGRDKVTIIASPGIVDFGAWLEQLLAESTGKKGRGLIPLAGEPLASPERYGPDRIFAYLELEGRADQAQTEAVDALARAGHPVLRVLVRDIWALGQEFFRWEIAVAVAGAIIGVDPFDQPDVEASKVRTRALMDAYEDSGAAAAEPPIFRENGVALYADPRNAAELGRHNTLDGYLKGHFARVKAGDYVALLAYVGRDAAHSETLTRLRAGIRDATGAATCLGFGPRFQHSTGQAFKGGPNTGVFLQITCDDPADLDVPGHRYSFGVVKAAQARGDLDVLVERGRRALRVHLRDVDAGLEHLTHAVEDALRQPAI
jgi:transaldolase/glucose-6-phosphate isomerase